MYVNKFSKTFDDELLAAICEEHIREELREDLAEMVVEFNRDGQRFEMFFQPETKAEDADFFAEYIDGFVAGYKARENREIL